ncbi:Subtilisin-like protease SBT2.4 [Linum grandiflorum]
MKYYEQHISRDARGQVAGFNGRARIGEGRVSNFGGRSPIVSRFSSRGPDYAIVDVLKPDILAPGHQVWAAWSPLSALEPLLAGIPRYSFALMSGTSMATAHVGGIAALVRQHNPSWNPSMIASAITTTASKYDSHVSPATYFDFGAGLISPGRALDPGLVLSSEFKDYIDFLCSLPDIDWVKIRAATGVSCNQKLTHLANLNLPSVTISALRFGHPIQLQRRFKSVGTKPETYLCYVLSPNGTTVSVSPTWFRIAPLQTQDIRIELHATAKEAVNAFSFGEIVLTGSLDHIVRLPLSVLLSSSTS